MKSKEIIAGVVGIVVGFIAGFFVSLFLEQGSSIIPDQNLTTLQDSSQLPEGHPPAEVMDRIRQLQDVAESNPQEREARIALGNSYYDIGRFDAAIEWYEEALGIGPRDVNVQTDLGTAYLYTGNAVKAVELYKQSLQIDPKHQETLQNIGVAYFFTGNYSEAVENWKKLIALYPNYERRRELEEQIEKAMAHLQEESL